MSVSSGGGGDGPMHAGGITLRMFAKDGEMSYSGQHPTSVFPLSVHTARPLQICSHIHLPFHLPSITEFTVMETTTSQEMKKEGYPGRKRNTSRITT